MYMYTYKSPLLFECSKCSTHVHKKKGHAVIHTGQLDGAEGEIMGGGCLYKCELAQQRRIKKKQLELTQKYIVSEPVGQRGNDNKSVDFVCFVLIFFSP